MVSLVRQSTGRAAGEGGNEGERLNHRYDRTLLIKPARSGDQNLDNSAYDDDDDDDDDSCMHCQGRILVIIWASSLTPSCHILKNLERTEGCPYFWCSCHAGFTEFRVQGSGFRVQGSGFRVQV